MKRFLPLLIILPLLLWIGCEENEDTSPELTEDCAGVLGGNNVCGCTDSTSVNYDSEATYDDGSCEYFATIVFLSNRDGDYEIYKMNEDGSNQTPLTNNDVDDWNGFSTYFSPDGNKIVFHSTRNGIEDVYIIDIDGNNETNLTNNNDGFDFNPVFTPDGTRIIFLSNRNGCCDLFMMNVDGTDQINLTNHAEVYSNDRFQCTPDGSKVVYSRIMSVTESHEIWSVDLNDYSHTQLSSDRCEDSSISPDGTKIVFVSSGAIYESNIDIYLMDIDGNNVVNLTQDDSHNTNPQFSPDGTKILYNSWYSNTNIRDLYIIDLDGSNKTKLTNHDVVGVGVNHPVFSPDGTKILFDIMENDDSEIAIMEVDGSNKINLTNNQSFDMIPQFQP